NGELRLERLGGVLGEVAELRVRVGLVRAGARRQLPGEQAQQRRLARAVRADDRDLLRALEFHVRVAEDVAPGFVAERGVAQAHERAARVRRRRELEADRARLARQHDALVFESRDLLALALRLRGLRVLRAKALDEA